MPTEHANSKNVFCQHDPVLLVYLDRSELLAINKEVFRLTYPNLGDHIASISDDVVKKSKIEFIMLTSERWEYELAVWCLIDNCRDQYISPLDMVKLQKELKNIDEKKYQYTTIDIINRLISQQNRHPHPYPIRYLIELLIYLQSGLGALQLFVLLSKDPSWSFPTIPNMLKVLGMIEWIPASRNNGVLAALEKNLNHPKHFLQCHVEIAQHFLHSIPEPYDVNNLIRLFDYFTDDINLLTIGALESFLSDSTSKPLKTCIAQLSVSICLQHVCKKLNHAVIPVNILSSMRYSIEKILLLSWSLNNVCDLLSEVQNTRDMTSINSVLTTIVEYGLPYDQTIFNFARRPQPSSQWSQVVHAYALQVSFSGNSKIFDLNELIDAFVSETYPDAQRRTTKKQQLLHQYDYFSNNFKEFSSMDRTALKHHLPIILRTNNFYAQVAFIIRASDLLLGHPMRIVQKLSILLALDSSSTTARILQINTGEGKTRIVAVLAAIKCLQGMKVDVITSSEELAKIQSEELKDFYAFFDLKMGCNANLRFIDYAYGRLRKYRKLIASTLGALGIFQPVYECDVIYGSASNFEADILRDEFHMEGVRCGRQCEFALVDEVDNMMIDGREQMLRLSSSAPSAFHLLPIKAIIWNQILNLAKMVMKTDDQWYKPCEDENGKTVPEVLEESIQEFAQQLILPLLKNYVHLNDTPPDQSSKKLIIPKHLHSFAEKQLTRWIKHAADAKFEMKEGREYVLKNNKIVYVDVNNTGVLHENMRWSDGLHCFLEMKHGCSIQSEKITTNFISHVTFFSRYSTNLIGLTGTVGGEATRHIFREVYSGDCLIIPPFREHRHHELQPRFTSKELDWLQGIVESCEEKMRQKRAVLIITKYIEQARTIASLLLVNFPTQVKLYTRSEEKNVVRETLKAGYVLVATNIAGRGTDILLDDEGEQNGGLHVCITFLPDNDRVERQNQGRTSRCGNKGTSQFIINLPGISVDLLNENGLLQRMREQRNQRELTQIKSAIEDVNRTIKKDQIFQKFSTSQDDLISCFPNNVRDIARNALREKFGF